MITQKMTDAINEQIKNEIYSYYLYLAMAAYFADTNLKGMEAWMRMQAKEEDSHAMKFFQYLLEQRAPVKLLTIPAPPADFDSPLDVFKKSFEHEKFVTAKINELVDIARAEKDKATEMFLQWYVTEQVEEESSFDEVIRQLNLVGDDGTGLYMLDQEMAARPFAPLPGIVNRVA